MIVETRPRHVGYTIVLFERTVVDRSDFTQEMDTRAKY